MATEASTGAAIQAYLASSATAAAAKSPAMSAPSTPVDASAGLKVEAADAATGSAVGIRDLIFKLEEEAQVKHQHQLRAMEEQLIGRDQQITAMKGAIAKLKDDFEYNLQLIASRDDELAQYDASLAEMQETMRMRDVALSDAQIALAEQVDSYSQLEGKCKELQSQVRQRDKQAEAATKLDARDAALQRGEEDRRRALEAPERAERRARRAEDALAARGETL